MSMWNFNSLCTFLRQILMPTSLTQTFLSEMSLDRLQVLRQVMSLKAQRSSLAQYLNRGSKPRRVRPMSLIIVFSLRPRLISKKYWKIYTRQIFQMFYEKLENFSDFIYYWLQWSSDRSSKPKQLGRYLLNSSSLVAPIQLKKAVSTSQCGNIHNFPSPKQKFPLQYGNSLGIFQFSTAKSLSAQQAISLTIPVSLQLLSTFTACFLQWTPLTRFDANSFSRAAFSCLMYWWGSLIWERADEPD